ncbi:MAG: hypothetical protein ACI8SE_001184 [Bacteroidia bacterium]|jgi:hypothetical protein
MSIRNITLLTALLFATSVSAQSIERSVVSTGGNTSTTASLSIEYTIGEMAFGQYSNTSIDLSAGFNQAYETDNSSIPVVTSVGRVSVYPNPTNASLNVLSSSNCTVRITSVQGLVMSHSVEITGALIHTLNVSHYASGLYILEVSNGFEVSYTKWIKN